MDYIKSWYEYFRGNTTNGSKTNEADMANELPKFGDKPPIEINPRRGITDLDSNNDIMRIFFGDSESNSNQSDRSSDTDSPWPFDMFRSANEMHKEFLNLVSELQNEFSSMQSFIFNDGSSQTSEDCPGCDGPLMGESLRDYYLRVPDLESIKGDNKSNELGIINPTRDSEGIITSTDGMPGSKSYFHGTQQIVSVSVGADGVLEITKIIKDSNGKSEKTVTKVDLKDRF